MGDVLYHGGYKSSQIPHRSTTLYENFRMAIPSEFPTRWFLTYKSTSTKISYRRLISLLKCSPILICKTVHQMLQLPVYNEDGKSNMLADSIPYEFIRSAPGRGNRAPSDVSSFQARFCRLQCPGLSDKRLCGGTVKAKSGHDHLEECRWEMASGFEMGVVAWRHDGTFGWERAKKMAD